MSLSLSDVRNIRETDSVTVSLCLMTEKICETDSVTLLLCLMSEKIHETDSVTLSDVRKDTRD